MNEMMTDVQFDEELEALWQRFFLLQNHADEEVCNTLYILMTQHKEAMDDASYMKLMYMKGLCYEEQGNKNAARYCALRMHAVQECTYNLKKKRPRFLDIRGYECSDEMNAFIERYTEFLRDTYKNINRRLLMVIGVMFFIVFLVLTLVLKIFFVIAGLEAVMLGMLTYLLQKRRMPEIFQKNQLNAIEKYVEEAVLEFDRPIRFS